MLSLDNEHYSVIQMKDYQKCKDRGRIFLHKHSCNTNRQVFKKLREKEGRYVTNGFKKDEFNCDEINIETHTRSQIEAIIFI